MKFKFHCIHCGQRISAYAEDQGTQGTCPACGGTFTVPAGMVEPVAAGAGAGGLPEGMPPLPPSAPQPPRSTSPILPRPSSVSMPAPAPTPPARTSAVDVIAANEAASVKRSGYMIVGGVVAVIVLGALFLNLPKRQLASMKDMEAKASPAAAGSGKGEAGGGAKKAAADGKKDEGAGKAEPKSEAKEDGDRLPPEDRQVMGGSRGTVDALLGGAWEVRPSGKKVPGEETVFYSSSDLEMIVHFRQDRAVGVNVIVPSGPNGKPIDGGRYRDLVRLLGAAPKDADVRKEGAGILEFKVGEM